MNWLLWLLSIVRATQVRCGMRAHAFLWTLIVVCLSCNAKAQCDDWRKMQLATIAGVSGIHGAGIQAVGTWDPDGAGPLPPQLVVGGLFSAAGGTAAASAARWDGSSWQPLLHSIDDSPISFFNIYCFTSLPTGSFGAFGGQLIMGGQFRHLDGTTISRLARWDGTSWNSIGFPTDSDYYTLVRQLLVVPAGILDTTPQLVVAGTFNSIGGVPARNIARWDGTNWHAFSSGLGADGSEVQTLALWTTSSTTRLVAGGSFKSAGGAPAHGVAMWNGSQWVDLGARLPYPDPLIRSMAVVPPGNGAVSGQLVVTGLLGFQSLARYDGTNWTEMPGIINNYATRLTTFDPDGAGPLPAEIIVSEAAPFSMARWDGSAFHAIGSSFDDLNICVGTWDPDGSGATPPVLVAGGFFDTINGVTMDNIAQFTPNAADWQPLAVSVPNTSIRAFAQLGNKLVAGGSIVFPSASNGATPNNIGYFDGRTIEQLGGGVNNTVFALKSFTTGVGINQTFNLVAGGDFTSADGVAANHVAMYSESVTGLVTPWRAMGTGFNLRVSSLERFNNVIYAGGIFSVAGNGTTILNNIAQWNGTTWLPVQNGLNAACNSLKVYNGALYAGGAFTTANNGAVNTGGLARWNGSAWSAVVGAFSGNVRTMEVFNNELILGGLFAGIPGTASPNIAKYNSATNTYSNLGLGGADGEVDSLVVENGNLYVGGAFTHIGGIAASHFAKWNGTSWSAVRGGADNTVFALAGFKNEVHAGGIFDTVRNGTISSHAWARYLETGIPWFIQQPASTLLSCHPDTSFTIAVADGYSYSVSWRHNGVTLTDGPTGTGSVIAGSTNKVLDIRNVGTLDSGTYEAVLTNSCGSITSNAAVLTYCVADTDDGSGTGVCDGGVTIDDLLYYLRIFEQGDSAADVDDGTSTGATDGGVTIDDLLYYLIRFEAGC